MDNDDDIDALASSAVAEEKPKKPRKTTTLVASGKKARPRRPKPKPARSPAVPVDDSTPDAVATLSESEAGAPTASKKKTMEQITNQIYRDAAERIVALMDAGNSIWQKPWVAPRGHSRPYSAHSGLPFSGFNRFSLMCEMLANGWTDARFMTYRQVQAMAASMANEGVKPEDLPHVKAGARGLPIYKFGFVEKKTPALDAAGRPRMDSDGKPIFDIVRGRSYLRSYTVFPASAIANMPQLPATEPEPVWAVRSQVEELIEKMGVPVRHTPGNRAYYSITTDSITMPARAQFKDTVDASGHVIEAASDKYLSVLLHEASHATGAKHRLARPMSGVHGSPSYGREELVAETAACFLLSETGLACAATSTETTARTAAYLSSWRQAILDDPKALMTAFAEAERAADWIMQRHPIQLEAAAKAVCEGLGIGHGIGVNTGVRHARNAPESENHSNWGMPLKTADWNDLGSFPMP